MAGWTQTAGLAQHIGDLSAIGAATWRVSRSRRRTSVVSGRLIGAGIDQAEQEVAQQAVGWFASSDAAVAEPRYRLVVSERSCRSGTHCAGASCPARPRR